MRFTSPRQRVSCSSTSARASAGAMLVRSAIAPASASTRPPVRASPPKPASRSCSSGPRGTAPSAGSAMRPRLATLAALLEPFAVDRSGSSRDELRRWRVGGGGLLRVLERLLVERVRSAVRRRGSPRLVVGSLPPRPLRLALLPHRQERCRDEDRRVRTGSDPDHEREREVLERRTAEEEQRGDREQRDE